MKALLILSLCLFVLAGDRTNGTPVSAADPKPASTMNHWPADALIKVYFVQDTFTDSERKVLEATMESWAAGLRGTEARISFAFAGETRGLIDCERCLTIARAGVSTNIQRQPVTFNTLRQDQTGRLLSAWIAFERSLTSSSGLKTLLLKALEQGFERGNSQAKVERR
jgi:hypothetical protein